LKPSNARAFLKPSVVLFTPIFISSIFFARSLLAAGVWPSSQEGIGGGAEAIAGDVQVGAKWCKWKMSSRKGRAFFFLRARQVQHAEDVIENVR
jgi:hypothetical protein